MKTAIERLRECLTESDGCLIFTGSKNGVGYGKLWADGKLVLAHRLAFAAARGPIPKGQVVCHRCDNPACCNLDHLFLGSQGENLRDMDAKGRRSRGPAHVAAIQAGWTTELRARRAQQTGDRMRQLHQEAALEAGVPNDWKRCPRCEDWKPMSDYHKNAAREDGHKPHCKPCSVTMDTDRRRRRAAELADPA